MIAEPLLVVGLGNPGERYRDTRHNIGFLVVEELARRLGWAFRDGDGPWREATEPSATASLVLLEPLTWMNRSGDAIIGWAHARGWPLPPAPVPVVAEPVAASAEPATASAEPVAAEPTPPRPGRRLLIVCDDLALPLGALRLRERGSAGGQRGLASVIDALGHDDVPRLRLGIAPAGEEVPPADWPRFVLTPFAAEEREAVADLVSRAAAAVLCCRDEGPAAAASRFNRR